MSLAGRPRPLQMRLVDYSLAFLPVSVSSLLLDRPFPVTLWTTSLSHEPK